MQRLIDEGREICYMCSLRMKDVQFMSLKIIFSKFLILFLKLIKENYICILEKRSILINVVQIRKGIQLKKECRNNLYIIYNFKVKWLTCFLEMVFQE